MFDVKSASIDIEGISPGLIMCNGLMADPLNDFSIRLEQLNRNKSKSVELLKQKSKVEFFGHAYVDDQSRPVIPIDNIHAALARGSSKFNSMKGKDYFSAIQVTDHARLIYDGPATIEELEADQSFSLRVPVVVSKQRIIRTRPIFRQWKATLSVEYETDFVDLKTLTEIAQKAGRFAGLGDWRPSSPKPGKYGRFIVNEIREN